MPAVVTTPSQLGETATAWSGNAEAPEISIVMPCLNEAETIAACIHKAQQALSERGIAGEIIVADNGSTDGSQDIACALGARVIAVAERGYGNALTGGIALARGQYVVFGDADDSYDFGDVPRFLERLREGFDLVMGNRFLGRIDPGAMPWSHRYIGNPVLTGIGRLLFGAPVGDFHCGLRAFRKDAFERMALRTTGMEFASEMVVKATLCGMRITEIPVDLHPDGRSRPPHLRSFRDGWRHLRFMLLFCPKWLFRFPGACLLTTGIAVSLVLLFGTFWVGQTGFDVHTLLVAGMLCLVGHQLLIFGKFARSFAALEGLRPSPVSMPCRSANGRSLEHGALGGLALVAAGVAVLAAAVWQWQRQAFGPLNPAVTMRLVIPGCVLITLGVQAVFGSFFLGLLSLPRK